MLKRAALRLSVSLRDDSGNALIEFAYVLPLMLMLFFGTVVFGDAIVLQRKVTNATRALADLTSQGYLRSSPTFSTATLTSNVMQGARLVIMPYDLTKALFTISDYCEDPTGKITVMWSEYYVPGVTASAQPVSNPVAPAISTTILPTPTSGTACITRSDIRYAYAPYIGNEWITPFTIQDHIFMNARSAPDIPFTP